MKQKEIIRKVCEGAVMLAMSLVLSYIEIPVPFGFGGSIDFVMVPLIIYAVRWGMGWGVVLGLLFGTLKFFFAGGIAVNWQSLLLDYSLAYGAVGFAGLLKGKKAALPLGATLGSFTRFIVHYISGVTIYSQYMPEEFMNMTMTTPAFYSLLYNVSYMLPNTVIAIAVCAALQRPLRKIIRK